MKDSSRFKTSKSKTADLIAYTALCAVALFGSTPLLSSSQVPPGFDSVMHLSKIRIFSGFFPRIPRWFPWWYCGAPSLRFYPPTSYVTATLMGWILQAPAVEAYQLTELSAYYLAGLSLYLFMRSLGFGRFSSFGSAVFYMLSPQTLYGRFFIGHFTHNFSMFLIPLVFFSTIKFGSHTKKLALTTAPLFALLFLSHLQTALSFGLTLGIYILSNVALFFRGGDSESISIHLKGILLAGVLGISLASFWLLPSLVEGSGSLGLTGESAAKIMIPIESLFVDAKFLSYLEPLQQIWSRQYFLGFPLILLSILAVVLIVRKQLPWKKASWGIIFASWTLLFLFGIVSPNFGLFLGWPNRLPYFVSMPMAMLAGLAMDWFEARFLSSPARPRSLKKMAAYLLLAALFLSPFIHSYDVERFVYLPFSDEIELSKRLDLTGLNPTERVASFGTFSYLFNVFSDGWQLDGGYSQGQINPDFYYKYWFALSTGDVDSVLRILNETNTRYVVFSKQTSIPSAYENRILFDRIETSGFAVFKLKDSYILDFVTTTHGDAITSHSYIDPDELRISASHCSDNVALLVKMNYYPGWVAHASQGEVRLTQNQDGLMKLEIANTESVDITLRYDLTLVDYFGIAVTALGAAACLFVVLTIVWKSSGDGFAPAAKRLLQNT